MTIFFANAGPLMTYQHGVLQIEDLNPEIKIQWAMTRWQRLSMGLRFLAAAIFCR